jgi:hypothetical protein
MSAFDTLDEPVQTQAAQCFRYARLAPQARRKDDLQQRALPLELQSSSGSYCTISIGVSPIAEPEDSGTFVVRVSLTKRRLQTRREILQLRM